MASDASEVPVLLRWGQRERPKSEVLEGIAADDHPHGLANPLPERLGVLARLEAELDRDEQWLTHGRDATRVEGGVHLREARVIAGDAG